MLNALQKTDPLLRVEALSLGFQAEAPVVRGVDLHLNRGEIVALAGESGCGKTLTALAILGLLPKAARVQNGSVYLDGAGDLLRLPPAARRRCRGGRIAMVFQDPAGALNPLFTIGFQIREVLKVHRGLKGRAAETEAVRLLEMVAMPEPETRIRSYSHELSGGQQQRAQLAIALAGGPDVLLADEPTTALDVTTQAQILRQLVRLRDETGLTILLITHDLGVVSSCCDRVMVMDEGRIIEQADVATFFSAPAHPHSRALLEAVLPLEELQAREDLQTREDQPVGGEQL